MPNDHAREESVFHAALQWPVAERSAFLERTCGHDTTLRARVEELLRQHERSFVPVDNSPAREADAWLFDGGAERNGADSLGSASARYELREKLGEGGWGAVYRAEQREPVRREVAIKIIKLGMDTRAVVARFQAERQALALMEHEHIARVFDAGETAQGRPFFAMELVRGTKITDYCDAHRLTLRARLELFMRVCDAVQHAHQKGVIHRDLKPSNILVARADNAGGAPPPRFDRMRGEGTPPTSNLVARSADRPLPKIIDFGIAKAAQGRLADATVVTEIDGFIGTPAYMSPEQSDTHGEAIDTRSDIYSLGVVLYELLTGTTPLAPAELRSVRVDEIRRQIRECDPPRPSARVRSLDAATLRSTAERRRLNAKQLADALAGDLDSVALKCLEKAPERRYESASALAQDLGRLLNDEPVAAHAPGRLYVFGKFARRHRVGFSVAAAIAVLLVAGVTVSTVLLFREKAALERAIAAEQEQAKARAEAELASRTAKTEAARSREVVRFTRDMLEGAGPAVAKGRDPTLLRELLDSADARISRELQQQPEVEIELRKMVAGVYAAIGERASDEMMRRKVLARQVALLGPEHPSVADALGALGDALQGQNRLPAAQACYESALAIQRRALGSEHQALLTSLTRMASSYTLTGKFDRAQETWRDLHRLQLKLLGPDDLSISRTEYWLARLQAHARRYDEAERLLRAYLEKYYANGAEWPTLGAGHPPTQARSSLIPRANVLNTLASMVLINVKKPAEAEAAAREAIALQRKSWNPDPETMVILARALAEQGRLTEAASTFEEAIALFKEKIARDRPNSRPWLAVWKGLLAWCEALVALKQPEVAEARLREHLAELRSLHPGEPTIPLLDLLLPAVLAPQGKWEEAAASYRAALAAADAHHQYQVRFAAQGYHDAMQKAGKTAELAAFWQERADAIRAVRSRPRNERTNPYIVSLLHAMVDCDQPALVEALAHEELALIPEGRKQEWPAFGFQALVGAALAAQGRFEEAEPWLVPGTEGLVLRAGALPYGGQALEAFARGRTRLLYTQWKRPEKLEEWTKRVAALRAQAASGQ